MKNLIWLRNHVVAPFSEEFIFRACMIPLLIPSVGAGTAVFLAPLFFGVAHFHHMVERVRNKHADLKTAFLQSLFQFSYTTVFGAYSAFLFIRTGSLVAPVVAHAFCNHMGFPDIGMVFQYPPPQRYKIMANFVIGLVLWCFLLYPLTHPPLFSNIAYNLLL
ncbi:CAAX prenyl protease 2-like [Lingula anatina]|uniref:CAAX prenyl protease 2 n=1 Tax=Lingula anatina TaxID=7574 RepID=A0A2R2MU12_LINAN|nr:CAAX prenyl protease 2-like [Lingula anatina]|eukprot:XP_023933537.1 CAAX prenyl protease 2-like [Lingula anatina]